MVKIAKGAIGLILSFIAIAGYAWDVNDYRVIWNSPGEGWAGAMPIGNGDIGASFFFEQNDLVFYISKTDSWDDNGRLAKVGKVRVSLSPNPFLEKKNFRQELDVQNGQILIRAGVDNPTSLRFWIDANYPVIQVESKSEKPVTAKAQIELWRTKRYNRPVEVGSPYRDDPKHRQHTVEPDVVLSSLSDDSIGWYHRNIKSIGPRMTMEYQGLQDYPDFHDPLLHRTFGAVVTGKGAKRIDDHVLESTGTENRFSIYVVTRQPATEKEWLGEVRSAMTRTEKEQLQERHRNHCAWWRNFWGKSWISIHENTLSKFKILPSNQYLFKIGADQGHGNVFGGKIGRLSVLGLTCTPEQMAGFAATGPDVLTLTGKGILWSGAGRIDANLDKSAGWGSNQNLTIETWVQPRTRGAEVGRILDKATPGVDDGFMLDTYPGNSLRLQVGNWSLKVPNCLESGKWSHVGVIFSASEKRFELYLNGKMVGSLPFAQMQDDAYVVSRGYNLQRYINACAGRGKFPIKFNGTIFNPGWGGDPDDRRWGQGYWWQNTRLPYTTMTLAGDFDLMEPLFHMYADVIYPLCKYRTKKYFGFDGAYFIECMYPWGATFSETYGWGAPQSKRKDPLQSSRWHKWEWVCGPELVFMMMDYCDFTDDYSMMESRIIPIAESIFSFFENYYKRDAQGKLLMHPSQACETWWDCTNPMPEISGLRAIATRLLQADKKFSTEEQRKRWKAFLDILPDFPTRQTPDGTALSPAAKFATKCNCENPELYAVFPFRQFGVGKEHLDWGLNAWKHTWDKGSYGWRQDNVFMAYMGMAEEARDYLVQRVKNYLGGYRFPVFWSNIFNAIPCQDHGSMFLRSTQAMLLQNDPYSDTIYLLPAWPKGWDAEFKLHAPHQTIIEAKVTKGRLVKLTVTPKSRQKDIVLCGGFASDISDLSVLTEK